MIARLGSLLDRTGQRIDIPDEARDRAIARYLDLAEWLIEHQAGLADVEIYPQGSFRLGTVVRPPDDSGDFDIDLVFLRGLAKSSITQDELRTQAGALLRSYCKLRGFDEPLELGRCWRIEFFDEGFHLDVLPVIPDETVPNGVLLSDKDHRAWLYSNPIGYAQWFYGRMNLQDFRERRVALAKALHRDVEQVPEFLVRAPLQRVVQLLKRGRDEYFAGRRDDAPPSILITTLAALAYRGQTDVAEALADVTRALHGSVTNVDGKWWVPNPAHPEENFADKWNLFPERRLAFYEWQKAMLTSIDRASGAMEFERAGSYLSDAFGQHVDEITREMASLPPRTLREAAQRVGAAPGEQFIEQRFPRTGERGTVSVRFDVAEDTEANRFTRRASMRRRRLLKERSVRFTLVEVSVAPPYSVFWKVRNFGPEALRAGALRGQIKADDGSGVLKESTMYRGEHYVDCYIVKDGCCVASKRTWVPID